MEIRCPGCSRKYIIPDDRLADRLSYVTCDVCGEKVVVHPRGGPRQETSDLMTASDILDGLRLSFNLRNCIVAFLALLSIAVLVFLSAVVASLAPSLLAEMPAVGAALAVLVGLLCLFIVDVGLYLVSKNNVHRMETGADIKYADAGDAIASDLKTVCLVSLGLPAICIALSVPFLLIGEGSVLYAGVTYPALVVCFAMLALAQVLKNLLMAFIAARPGSVGETLKGMLRFIARENINIPLYLILIRAVSAVFFVLVALVPLAGMLLVVVAASLSGAGPYAAVNGLLSGGLSALGPGTVGNMPLDVQSGIVLAAVFSIILVMIGVAYLMSLWQTLSSVAVAIMESNPGRSISRTAVLAWIFLAAVLAWGVLASALMVGGLVHLVK